MTLSEIPDQLMNVLFTLRWKGGVLKNIEERERERERELALLQVCTFGFHGDLSGCPIRNTCEK